MAGNQRRLFRQLLFWARQSAIKGISQAWLAVACTEFNCGKEVTEVSNFNPTDREPQGAFAAIPSTVDLPKGIKGEKWAIFLQALSLHTSLTPERKHHGYWVNLHSGYLKRLLGRKYKESIREMKAQRVIEENPRYSTTHGFSKSYRLTEEHRHGKSKLHLVQHKPSAKRLIKTYEVDEKNLGPTGMHFRQNFDRFFLDKAASSDPNLQDHWDQWTIARWHNRQEFAKRCDYRRYHCLLTQLPTEARHHLRTKTQDNLTIVDISACQPNILGMLAASNVQPLGNHNQNERLLSYVDHFSVGRAQADVRHWIDLCEKREYL